MLNKKQLNRSHAHIYYDGDTIADSDIVALVSYQTLIFVWQHHSRTLYVGECFDCSATTRQHSSKFLRMLSCGIDYHRVKYWLTKCFNGYTGEIINIDRYRDNYGYDALIYPCFHNSLYWRNQFSSWRLENAINENRLG